MIRRNRDLDISISAYGYHPEMGELDLIAHCVSDGECAWIDRVTVDAHESDIVGGQAIKDAVVSEACITDPTVEEILTDAVERYRQEQAEREEAAWYDHCDRLRKQMREC